MMERNGFAAPFAATVFFAGPASLAESALGLTADVMVTTKGNRWSVPGEPTIYLASDVGVALAEFGRHTEETGIVRAHVWPVRVELDMIANVRSTAASGFLDLPTDASWPLDRERCSALARHLRETGEFEGVIVPTVAMLDRAERWNLVIFVDRLKRPIAAAVSPQDLAVTIDPR